MYYSLIQSDLTSSGQFIYSFLLDAYEMNNKLKIIKPLSYSVAELSKKLNYSKKGIRDGLDELEEKKYIKIIKEKNKKSVFLLTEEKYNEIVNT